MTQTQTRVVGSGFTTFNYRGKPIAFLEGLQDSGQQPIAQPEPIMPLGDRYPREIATPRAVQAGTLTLTIRELWNGPVWQQLTGLSGAATIVDVYEAFAKEKSAVTCQMVIKSPDGKIRGKTYQNCVIIRIDDSESVTMGALTIPRQLTVMYTHTTPIKG